MIAYLRRVSEMTHAAAAFCAEHRETLGNGPKLQALLTALQTTNREIQQLAVASISSDSDRQASVRHRQTLAREIRREIGQFRDFAPIIEDAHFAHQCKCPTSRSHEALRIRARAILEILQPLEPTLFASDLPIDAIPRFAANLQAFEAATETATTSRHNRITANSDLEAKVKEARTLVRKIGAILQFRMRHAPDFLAAWQSVSHIQRAPERKADTHHMAAANDTIPDKGWRHLEFGHLEGDGSNHENHKAGQVASGPLGRLLSEQEVGSLQSWMSEPRADTTVHPASCSHPSRSASGR